MQLLRASAFVGRYSPASERLISGLIVAGDVQIPIRVDRQLPWTIRC